ncbi:hypothetical protein AOLI_G00022280 [Acnodon oligacanthus]
MAAAATKCRGRSLALPGTGQQLGLKRGQTEEGIEKTNCYWSSVTAFRGTTSKVTEHVQSAEESVGKTDFGVIPDCKKLEAVACSTLLKFK